MDQAVQRLRDTTLAPNYVVLLNPEASIFVRQAGSSYLYQQMSDAFASQPGIQSGLRADPVSDNRKMGCVFGLTGMGHVALEQAINENPKHIDKKDFLSRMLNAQFERVREQGDAPARWAGDACKVLETAQKLSQPRSLDTLDLA